MATVFLAQDTKHHRPVALKVLHPELAHALGPERFQREVELAARLQHPHILTVFDSGEAAGHLWFTMPFVEGESLRDRLTRERQLSVEDAVRIATEAARGLEYAHQHGVIHRDIKPENILLTSDGSILVADFGIARAFGSGQGGKALTETGMAVGTPAYMSPEQASGERDLDARTDVYALGSVLFEMLAGEPPFTGPTAQAIIARRMRGEVPDVRATRPSVPRPIGEAVTRALAPVPADRFASAAEFARALTGALTASLTSARPSVPAAQPTATRPARTRRMPAGLSLLLVGFLIGVGVLFAWRRGGRAAGAASQRVIAVLPFENQGDSAQEFFADGITDAVRGKLSALPGIQVIAGGSSRSYKQTTKPLPEVAKELGADYLLVATVRWARNADGTQQVMVSPELVSLEHGRATSKWQEGFQAALTNVFEVQANIAGKVAGALNLALADSTSRQLAARPTSSFTAYDLFLRGEDIYSRGVTDPVPLRQAISYYRQAVGLDSGFALAWAQLSRASTSLYGNSLPDPSLAEAAYAAAERALALDPQLPEAHQAMGNWLFGVRDDLAGARQENQIALRLAPGNSSVLRNLANLELAAGAWDSALVHARKAERLDPRSPSALALVGNILLNLRRNDEARATIDRAIALGPTTLNHRNDRFMVDLADGRLDSARGLLRRLPPEIPPAALVANLATYWDMGWALDEQQQRLLLSLTPHEFDDDLGTYGIVMAEASWLRGDLKRARSAADTALRGLEAILRQSPNDTQSRLFLALAKAYLGRKAEAIREGEAAVALMPFELNAIAAAYFRRVLTRLYVVTGEPEKAIDLLEELLQRPGHLSPAWLRIDPHYAPLRDNPRFRRLIQAV